MAEAAPTENESKPRGCRRLAIVLAGVAVIWACVPLGRAMWGSSQGNRLTLTIVNETDRPLDRVKVACDGGWTGVVGSVGPRSEARKVFYFTHGQGRLSFRDGLATTTLNIGMLFNDDGPYEIKARVSAPSVRVAIQKNEPTVPFTVPR